MASVQSKIFNILLKLIDKKNLLKRNFARGSFNKFTSPSPVGGILRTCKVQTYTVCGRRVYTLKPRREGSKKHVLYLHGGAYVTTFVRLHWDFLAALIADTGCTITTPDYPLAPAQSYKEAFEMVVPIYHQLLLSVQPDDLILMGDSAGGGFALALAQKIKLDNMPQPGRIILLSPWLDLTLSNPEIARLDAADPFTGVDGLLLAGKAYAGGEDPGCYLLSPINGPLEGLGKISIFVGTKEILVADTRRLKALMEAKGVIIDYHEYKDMTHVWMLLHFPESRRARRMISALLR
jgi:epsilon-lactone hydrolase